MEPSDLCERRGPEATAAEGCAWRTGYRCPVSSPGPHSQSGFDVRLDWGVAGLRDIAPGAGCVVVVDVLSFSTTVEVACSRGATVYPASRKDDSAQEMAARLGASLAVSRHDMSAQTPYSLSPASLSPVESGDKVVLPSPNGAQVTLTAAELGVPVFAGCLRNRTAVTTAAGDFPPVAVIAAGERRADGSLRPAWEDLVGAGAIIDLLPGSRWPESDLAARAWVQVPDDVLAGMLACASGRELVQAGYRHDVEMAAEVDVSRCVPMLTAGAFVRNGAR
jgi:2-phosphosulfolactate phosphatase